MSGLRTAWAIAHLRALRSVLAGGCAWTGGDAYKTHGRKFAGFVQIHRDIGVMISHAWEAQRGIRFHRERKGVLALCMQKVPRFPDQCLSQSRRGTDHRIWVVGARATRIASQTDADLPNMASVPAHIALRQISRLKMRIDQGDCHIPVPIYDSGFMLRGDRRARKSQSDRRRFNARLTAVGALCLWALKVRFI